MTMTINKPSIPRVYVQITNPTTGKSRSRTLYNTDENRAMDDLVRLVESQQNPPPPVPDTRQPERRRAS